MRAGRLLASLGVAGVMCCAAPARESRTMPPRARLQDGRVDRDKATIAPTPKVLQEIALMATGESLGDRAAEDEAARIQSGNETVAGFVSRMLSDPRFAKKVAPEILFGDPWFSAEPLNVSFGYKLRERAGADGEPLYHLYGPCKDEESVAVRPWWAMDTEVRVCPDSYRPTRIRNAKGLYCGGEALAPVRSGEKYCGCGPNLIFCVRERDIQPLHRDMKAEVWDTVAAIVQAGRPVVDVFTTNETVRGPYSEFYYERERLVQHRVSSLSDMRAWNGTERPVPRTEMAAGQHAGVLTTGHIMRASDSPRSRMRDWYDLLWCAGPSSVHVTAGDLLRLGTTDLRDAAGGWQKLAAMPICTDCHARLDYGLQFSNAYPGERVGIYFEPERVKPGARGKLYARDIDDFRAEGELTTAEFVRLAVRQPEFASCMAQRVSEHVFNDSASPAVVHRLEAVMSRAGTLQSLMQTALVSYAEESSRPSPVSAGTGAAAVGEWLRPSAALGASVDEHCSRCHDASTRPLVREEGISRATARQMLSAVAFRGMPKDGSLAEGERVLFIRELVYALWTKEQDQKLALDYFVGNMRGAPLQRGVAMRALMEAQAGRADAVAHDWPVFQAGYRGAQSLDSVAAVIMATSALQTCKGLAPEQFASCLKRAADPIPFMKLGLMPGAERGPSSEQLNHRSGEVPRPNKDSRSRAPSGRPGAP